MLDYTTNPPVWRFNQHTFETYLAPLQPRRSEGPDGPAYEIAIPAAREALRYLMHMLDLPYDARGVSDKRESFSASEQRLLYPYAFMLACLDGNAFTGENAETVTAYIPDAFHVIRANRPHLSDEAIFAELARYAWRAHARDLPFLSDPPPG